MKYQPTINIWTVDPATLQPGQWVSAGQDEGKGSLSRGRFYGVKASGTVVVAWQGNARGRGRGGYRQYQQTIKHYASN